MMSDRAESITAARFLWRRLREIGVDSVHGVPGDYNLSLLDSISTEELKWVGNCNELNAGYAADGYARVKGIGAIVTTGGVGELSAINAHAGAYAEQIALVHIVGSTALSIRGNGRFKMHHTLGNDDHNAFQRMFEPISVEQVSLRDTSKIPEQIDHILKACWTLNRPVYIDVPSDMANRMIDGARLSLPLDLSYPLSDEGQKCEALRAFNQKLSVAKRPCILVDMCATRQRISKELDSLVRKSQLPTFVTPLAQGFVNESLANYGGIYAGKGSHPGVQQFVENSDLVLHIGPLDTDVTTYLGSANIKQESVIKLFADSVEVSGQSYTSTYLRPFIFALLNEIDFRKYSAEPFQRPPCDSSLSIQNSGPVTQEWLWPYISSWLRTGDIVLTDTGTAGFGILDTMLPPEAMLINSCFWASLGYSLASAQGAALAAKDSQDKRRTILFLGDGSFQLTCQEISTMIKHRLQVTIFVICNNGYTIERAVHQTSESYNDIMNWNHCEILRVFDVKSEYSRSFRADKQEDLQVLLADQGFANYAGVQLVELHVSELDIPKPLKDLARLISAKQVAS